MCKTVFCIKSCTKCLAPLLKLLASSLCLHNTIELFLTWRSNPVPSGVKIQVIKSSRIHLHIAGNLICLQCKTRKNHPFNVIMLGFQSIKCQRQFCTYTMHHEHQRVKSALTKGVGWQNISFFRAKKIDYDRSFLPSSSNKTQQIQFETREFPPLFYIAK